MTPLRVSFMGGGTDFPRYYSDHGGIVVSAGIQAHVYVTVMKYSPMFGERYRISYSETERRADRNSIENGIVRGCLELLNIDEPLHISTSADVPAMSGLGSSSSFAVGLLLALHAMHGEDMSAAALAEEACQVELEVLGKPIGKQDQYIAAYGGLSGFHFRADGRVEVDHRMTLDEETQIAGLLRMFYRHVRLLLFVFAIQASTSHHAKATGSERGTISLEKPGSSRFDATNSPCSRMWAKSSSRSAIARSRSRVRSERRMRRFRWSKCRV
jgi:galactokinase/mevalonate kinase-like predicted kinase